MARRRKEVEDFVNSVHWGKIKNRWGLHPYTPNLLETEEFKKYWRQNPELRPGQALINLGLIKDDDLRWGDTTYSLLNSCHKDG